MTYWYREVSYHQDRRTTRFEATQIQRTAPVEPRAVLSEAERLQGLLEMFPGAEVSSITRPLTPNYVRELARECGFSLAGIAPGGPVKDFGRYQAWVERGLAGEMRYLTDHRGQIRVDPARLLPGCRSIICTGLNYNGPEPYSTEFTEAERAWISRYAWGDDYHAIIRAKLEQLARKLLEYEEFSWRACVDTAPLLERSLARAAGLGWIGRNTCVINQGAGSWFFLGELLTTLDIEGEN